jgi:hypothetical protein
MGFEVVKYDHPVIFVQDSRGRIERFSVGENGAVEDRGTLYNLGEFRRAAIGYLISHRATIPRRHGKGGRWSRLILQD